MIKGMHTEEGGAVVIGGHRVFLLEPRHDLASYMDAAANDERATRPLWMSVASRLAAAVLAVAVCAVLLACSGALS